ncbi:hypothetical protein Hypma_014453 [Hypsizygus marmoreus]|uniref:DUF5648 domain-containing protein n=1 Tax=Hypsizygus marmoreus TaxID=39966 RepID=A0A369JHA0_HYPMA|nr:hypothetical protein Hypma_014453 [Hypsizygus marmoreus]
MHLISANGVAPTPPAGYTQVLGIAAYVYPTQTCCSAPFYVIYSATLGDHFYTTDITERDAMLRLNGYVDQGIAGYVLPIQRGCGCNSISVSLIGKTRFMSPICVGTLTEPT